jgi:hypothetical protein
MIYDEDDNYQVSRIAFSERGNPRRYTINLPRANNQFHAHMLQAIGGEFNFRPRPPRITGAPDLIEVIREAMEELVEQTDRADIASYTAEGEVGECSICLGMIKAKDTFKRLSCSETTNHCFHSKCITPWLRSNNTCPNCRAKVL